MHNIRPDERTKPKRWRRRGVAPAMCKKLPHRRPPRGSLGRCHRERMCADTVAVCRFTKLAISNAEIYFSDKIHGSNLTTDSTRKQLRFEISKMLIAV